MKVGLVLGAGGVLGGAWLTGALEALAKDTGWDPGTADALVGTSAGSMISALLAGGVPPWYMNAHSRGERFEGLTGADGRPADEADRSGGASLRLHRGAPPIGPGSPALLLSALRFPARHTPQRLALGMLPRGVFSTAPLADTVRRVVPSGWAEHDALWIVACDYSSGRRVAFGRAGAPEAELAQAVAASCAIPGFYHPVSIGGRRYVDGGVRSASNLDLLAGEDLDLVVCLNPTSVRGGVRGSNPIVGAWRAASRRRLALEARRIRAQGAEVVLIEPGMESIAAMGGNLMSGRRRNAVIETAAGEVAEQLREPWVRDRLAGLPAGEPHRIRRPDGPPSTWQELVPRPGRAA